MKKSKKHLVGGSLFLLILLIAAAGLALAQSPTVNKQQSIKNQQPDQQSIATDHQSASSTSESTTSIYFLQRTSAATEIYKIDPISKNKQKIFTDADEDIKIISQGGLTANGQNILLLMGQETTATGGNLFFAATDGSGKKEKILGDFASAVPPVISPDGQKIAAVIFSNAERDGFGFTLYAMNKDGSDKQQLVNSQTAFTGLAWQPESQIIVFISQENNVYKLKTVNLANKEIKEIYNAGSTPIRHPLATAEKIYFVQGEKSASRIWAVSPESGQLEKISQDNLAIDYPAIIDKQWAGILLGGQQESNKLVVGSKQLIEADEIIAWRKND